MNSSIFIKIVWSITLWLHICGFKNCKKSFKNFIFDFLKFLFPLIKFLTVSSYLIQLGFEGWASRMARPCSSSIVLSDNYWVKWPTFLWRTFELFERVKIWSAGAWLLFCSINGVDLWSDFRSEFQLLVSFYIE